MSRISIIIPVYYNEDTLMLLYEDMKTKILDSFEDYEIVMIDDGSGDGSYRVMEEIYEKDPYHIRLVKLSRNYGEHAAILAGLNECTGDCAVTKQADLQEDSELILQMYHSWKKGNKVVLAVREERDEGKLYQFFAHLYYRIMKKLVNPAMPKGGFDCFLLDRQVIEVLKMFDEKNSALTLQVLWVGFKSDKINFHRKARTIGKSRWTMSKKIKLIIDSLMSFSYAPIRWMSYAGVLFFVIALMGIIGCIYETLFIGTRSVGWASLMSVVLLTSGIIMLMLGILGEYIWRTLDACRNRPPFLIDETREQAKKRNMGEADTDGYQ